MKPPTFFLSSTIYDFKDLRSAIKHHLERQGCRVLASEFNDFSKPLEKHSYDACLEAIQQADWFVLLIGSRVGGWYDEAARVSITQQEYREAYRLHRQGRLKLLVFVRSEVWQLREERRQLARHLGTLDIDPASKAAIANFPSKSATDAAFLSDFITEVSRNQETRAALASGGPLPTGNWVHVFDTFQDVIDAIQLQPFAGRPIEDLTVRELLRRELSEIVRQLLVKSEGVPAFSPRASVDAFHASHSVSIPAATHQLQQVRTKLFDNLCSRAITLMSVKLHPKVLDKALESSAFLRIDAGTGAFAEEPVYPVLVQLQEELRRFEVANQFETLKIVFENSPTARPVRGETLDVPALALLGFLNLLDRWCNVLSLCKAVIQHLGGADLVIPALRPRSPASKEAANLATERVANEELAAYLRDEG